MNANYSYLSDGAKASVLNASGTGYDYNGTFTYSHASGGTRTLESVAFGIAQDDFGARLYDRSSWTSIDPLAEKYYSLSPYAYCAGNPVNFVDPEGNKIKFASGVSNTFKDLFAQTIEFMNYYGTANKIAKLEESSNIYYINEVSSIKDICFNPNTKEICWSPYFIAKSFDGIMSSPATILDHEINHALLFDNFITDPANKNEKYYQSTEEEENNVIFDEQKTARKQKELFQNQVTRFDHKKMISFPVGNMSPYDIHEIVSSNNYQLWELENVQLQYYH